KNIIPIAIHLLFYAFTLLLYLIKLITVLTLWNQEQAQIKCSLSQKTIAGAVQGTDCEADYLAVVRIVSIWLILLEILGIGIFVLLAKIIRDYLKSCTYTPLESTP
ncbi:hypothetical protein HK098_002154, partial [Nowakowskiella sp. JEL0407]